MKTNSLPHSLHTRVLSSYISDPLFDLALGLLLRSAVADIACWKDPGQLAPDTLHGVVDRLLVPATGFGHGLIGKPIQIQLQYVLFEG